jgi:hypothetical protein
MNLAWPWAVLALLGAYHGLNPGMGWLFALALGLQEKRRSAVLWALLPIALGHAAAIALAIIILSFIQHWLPFNVLKWLVAAIIFSLGVYRLFRAGHPRGAGMRVGARDLFLWSFLMASAHGAGLMLIPVLMSNSMSNSEPGSVASMHDMTAMHHNMAVMSAGALPISLRTILLSTFVHTAAMLIVAGTLAVLAFESYERVGLKILRSAWFNFDLLWACALLIAGVTVLLH